jgi:hypothetical protein
MMTLLLVREPINWHCNKCLSVIMSLKRAGLLAPKRAVFVAGVSLNGSPAGRAGNAGKSSTVAAGLVMLEPVLMF